MHRILNFFKGGGNNGAPPKEQGRRNLWLATLGVLGIVLLVIANTGGSKAGVQPNKFCPARPRRKRLKAACPL